MGQFEAGSPHCQEFLELSGQQLRLEQIVAVANGGGAVLSESARARMTSSRRLVEGVLQLGQVVYGVNTGFGKLSDVRIPASELRALQLNLVRSHACGVGNPLSHPEMRAMMLLRANVLALGHSGCRVELAETLLRMLCSGVYPVTPEKGSVGASGDLAPLAHLALGMVGEGESWFEGAVMPSAQALLRAGIPPVALEAKEGLALVNGTQAMGAVGGLAVHRAARVARLADLSGAMSLEALRGTPAAFDDQIHRARPHQGQLAAAASLRALMQGSEIRRSHVDNDPRIQDPYSLRCMPQVHGAVRQTLQSAIQALEIESGSATDNPLVFPETGQILSGGNFHGAPLALALDYSAIGLTQLLAMSERRIDRLVNPDLNEGLPPFLSADPGRSSGYMIAQVCAAALLNESKLLAHPASIDSVPTSGGKEDHVSMGMTAALKLRQLVDNAELILAIELVTAAEALDYRLPLRSSPPIERARARLRALVPRLTTDRSLSVEIQLIAGKVRHGAFDDLIPAEAPFAA